MSHRPWPGVETGRAKLTSSEIALQEQPVQPHRDPPVTACPVVSVLRPPPSPHGGRFAEPVWDLRGSGPDMHVDMDPAIQLPGLAVAHGAGGCPWGWWISTSLTAAYIPTLLFSTPDADWPSSACVAAMRTGPPPLISIGFSSLLSLIVESKPKSQLFKFYVDVMNTWQHK